ncbi:MAG: right-handed parallel beta-helix repeat-containing protein [Methylococcaceae bacterium]
MNLTKVSYSMIKGASVNVLDFGASPSSSAAANTSAIQAAYSSLTGGGSVIFPKGIYNTIGQITIAYSIETIGEGKGNTIINCTSLGTNKAAFLATASNCSFKDFTLVGPSTAAYVADEQGIWLYGTSGSPKSGGVINNIEVYNFGSSGINAEYYHKTSVVGCYVHDCGYIGISGSSVNDFIATNNTVDTITPGTGGEAYGITLSVRNSEAVPKRFVIDGNTINNVLSWEGIDTHGGQYGVISNNTITKCRLGINVSPTPTTHEAPNRISIIGNVIDASFISSPFRAIGSGGYDVSHIASGIVCAGNTISGMGDATLYVEGAIMFKFTKDLIVSNNSIADPNGTGISLYDANNNCTVIGNTVAIVQSGSVNASGIVVNASGQTGIITNNNIEAIAGQFGIYAASPNLGVLCGNNQIVASSGNINDNTYLTQVGYLTPFAIRAVNNGTTSIAIPAGIASSYVNNLAGAGVTITLAAPLYDGERRRICFGGVSTGITWAVTSPATAVVNLPTTVANQQCIEIIYNSIAGAPTNSPATSWLLY